MVGTQMSNLGLEHALAKQQIPFTRTAVGDRYVLEMLQQQKWYLGGESSGHIICLDRTTTGDAIVSALQVLHELASTDQNLHEAKRAMSKYPQKLINVPVTDLPNLKESPLIRQAVLDIEHDLGDTGRVLLRPSGTEPLVRVMVEGVDLKQVQILAEQLAATVTEASNKLLHHG